MTHTSPDTLVFQAVLQVFDTATAAETQALFLDIKRRHNEEGRFHHTYGRMAGLLDEASRHSWQNEKAAIATILYQDIINPALQAPGRTIKFESASYAASQLKAHGQGAIANIVLQHIGAQIDYSPLRLSTADTILLCDISRMDMGKPDMGADFSDAINIVAEKIHAVYDRDSDTARGLSVVRGHENNLLDRKIMLMNGGTLFRSENYAPMNARAAANIANELTALHTHIWPRAAQKAQSAKELRVDNSFPFVSGLHPKIA